MGPELIRVMNGHEMSLFDVHDQGGAVEEVVFWCHSCDPEGTSITSVLLTDHTHNDAYALLMQYARLHEEFPVDTLSEGSDS
jgi:hypothetical protein